MKLGPSLYQRVIHASRSLMPPERCDALAEIARAQGEWLGAFRQVPPGRGATYNAYSSGSSYLPFSPGWVSRDGTFYACDSGHHLSTLSALTGQSGQEAFWDRVAQLERGLVKIEGNGSLELVSYDVTDTPTPAQLDTLQGILSSLADAKYYCVGDGAFRNPAFALEFFLRSFYRLVDSLDNGGNYK